MKKVRFRILSHQGDELKTYTREDAIKEFELLSKTMTPMVVAGVGEGGAENAAVVIDGLTDETEEVTWLPKVAGG